MKTIIVLTDLSDLTFKVLKQAHTLAAAFHSQVIILHVVTKEPVVFDVGLASPTILQTPSKETPSKETLEKHYAQLLDLSDSLNKFGVSASVEQLDDASVENVLAETRRLGADLIILGSHHHSTLYRMLVGTVTDDVLKHAHCPVLVVPGDVKPSEKT